MADRTPGAEDRQRASVLAIDGVSKTYGTGPDAFRAIQDVTLKTEPGEMLCIVGPSGCGKTTLLRCVSGLMPATTGRVELDGAEVTSPPRPMALVFQDYSRSLLPWMDIAANVTLPLKAAGVPRKERIDLARDALASVGLAGDEQKYPWQLSGGMQQRAAIARALAYEPSILLLDEPFASVDAQTRADLEDLLLDVWERKRLTVLLVTHDIDEAVYLASRVVVLSASPTHVKEVIPVDLPRPRDQLATKELPEFAHLRARVFASIKAESSAGAGRADGATSKKELPGERSGTTREQEM
jgi:NitT/TauT family transport system ATP-binding protein